MCVLVQGSVSWGRPLLKLVGAKDPHPPNYFEQAVDVRLVVPALVSSGPHGSTHLSGPQTNPAAHLNKEAGFRSFSADIGGTKE